MATPMDSFKQYVMMYNDARASGDISTAQRIGKKIIDIAEEECSKPGVSESYKEAYRKSANAVREYIADCRTVKERPSKEEGDEITKKDWFDADIPNLTLADVAGLEDVKNELTVNVFAPLSPKYSAVYHKYRKDVGLQLLLWGPPGTGKTHLVKCLAGQLKCKIAVVQIKDVMASLVGDGAKIIATIFDQAKKYDRCIIFFDEIDAIAASRENDESRHTKEQLTTLLTYMDGFTSGVRDDQIRIVVAATNRPWILDSAVKRGGRFDTQIYVPLPDTVARRKLVAIAMGKDESVKNRIDVPFDKDVTVDYLAEKFEGYAGADIKAVCKQIVNRPLRREIDYLSKTGKMGNDCVTRKDCDEVIGKYINSITDEMLMRFDAYKANMEFDEFVKYILPLARACRKRGEAMPYYLERWLDSIDN